MHPFPMGRVSSNDIDHSTCSVSSAVAKSASFDSVRSDARCGGKSTTRKNARLIRSGRELIAADLWFKNASTLWFAQPGRDPADSSAWIFPPRSQCDSQAARSVRCPAKHIDELVAVEVLLGRVARNAYVKIALRPGLDQFDDRDLSFVRCLDSRSGNNADSSA